MSSSERDRLRQIKTFPSLVKYLRDELSWPIESNNFDDITFDYAPEELGLDSQTAVKIEEIKQLRPLVTNQPWGIFFIKFAPKKLPIVALRRILGQLVFKNRASSRKPDRASWNLHDLLFISNYGEGDERQITFAHFTQGENKSDLPALKVLGWDDEDTALHLDDVHEKLKSKLFWPADECNLSSWRKNWAEAFVLRPREVITTSQELAIRLADLARRIRRRAIRVMKVESERGPLRKLHKAFRDVLIHDLGENDFADMYAQTITYGLFSSAVFRPADVAAHSAAQMVPMANSFLKEMLQTFLAVGGRKDKLDFDELGIQEVVELLNSPDTHMEAVLRDFDNRNPQEDPVIHFYEHFLNEYDKQMKVSRGVFYTPKPVVSYIVRSVHELLQSEFGLEDGLASTETWADMIKKNKGIETPKGTDPAEAFVQILDPATGTGTFLVEVIDLIHRTMTAKWLKLGNGQLKIDKLWDEYVSKNLLPRLYGYELIMAPYAIAHIKIGLKLLETGYRFKPSDILNIYLTNSLEPPSQLADEKVAGFFEPLANEAKAVNAVKRHKRFTIIIGNPPYANFGRLNKNEWILGLLEDYKKGLEERKINLDDDYIKFIRYMQYLIQVTGIGIISIITNNSYLDGITHRKMRHDLVDLFEKIFILNLHGNLIKKEGDENVFDIRVGVGVATYVKTDSHQKTTSYFSTKDNNIITREEKYAFTANKALSEIEWQQIEPKTPGYWFVPKDSGDDVYRKYWSVTDIFQTYSVGIGTKVDSISIDFDADVLKTRIKEILQRKYSRKELIKRFSLSEKTTWEYERALRAKYNEARVVDYDYRPFDTRKIFYDDNFLSRSRSEVMDNLFINSNNLALVVPRQAKVEKWQHCFVTDKVSDESFLAGGRDLGAGIVLPLYIFERSESLFSNSSGIANFTEKFQSYIKKTYMNTCNPIQIFHYIYAILFSEKYRDIYLEELKVDYPRIPFASNDKLFLKLLSLGEILVQQHLLKTSKVDEKIVKYQGSIPSEEVEKISYENNTIWIDKAKSSGFIGVGKRIWEFYIGTYQVCEKWLKDRKGRKLSKSDIEHYQKIVTALNETIKIMAEIDKVIDSHGGWPGAFQK